MFSLSALWFRREMQPSRSSRPARRRLWKPWVEALESRDLPSSWSTLAPMPTARFGLAAATGPDGRTYAIGGYNNAFFNTVEAFNGSTWTSVAPMLTARTSLAVATGSDGRIYAIGGVDKNGIPQKVVEAYNV